MSPNNKQLQHQVLEQCQAALPTWRHLSVDDVEYNDPKGFSSFTMGVRPQRPVDPPAVLFQRATLVAETRRCLMLSDYMYAMAARPLALEPIQRIRFIP